jgi:hypothetical protein
MSTTYEIDSPSAQPARASRDDSCKQLYERLATLREPYLMRARLCAAVTIPWLMPPFGWTGSQELPTPFQSTGARGVNNLSSKIHLALYPPNAPWFEFKVDAYALKRVAPDDTKQRQEIEQSLIQAQEAILVELQTSGFHTTGYECARHLVVTGNILQQYDTNGSKAFHLDQYVVVRDPKTQKPVLLITKECMAESTVPPELMQFVSTVPAQANMSRSVERTFDLFTHCEWSEQANRWIVVQEFNGQYVPDSYDMMTEDTFPYFVLRGNVISGEDYGRGYVEEYLGALLSLEGLAQSIVEGSAQAARVNWLVNPAGLTDKADLEAARNGAYLDGVETDVSVLQLGKFGDFQITGRTAAELRSELEMAFLMNSAVQRQAERVTAEEIRFVAEELEQALGGIYTLLSREWQLPLVKHVVALMQRQDRLPYISKTLVHPAVVTGIEALGRGNDLNRLLGAANACNVIVGPGMLGRFLSNDGLDAISRVFTAAGVKTEGLLKRPEEYAAMKAQEQQQALMARVGPQVATQVGSGLRDQMAAKASEAQQQQ